MCNSLVFIRVVSDLGSEHFEVKNLHNESIITLHFLQENVLNFIKKLNRFLF